MPLISVVLPVYNGEKTIQATIESVLSQTLSEFELIIINDGSQDKTLEIVSSIKSPKIKVFSYPNSGPNSARNRGIDHAQGEYIAFVDADDLWTIDKLESQFKALKPKSEVAVAYSWTDYIDQFNQFLRRGSHISVTGDVYPHLLLSNFLENGSNPLIQKQALITAGGFNESLTHAEDWDMWLRLARLYHFVAVPSPQILYRVSPDSSSFNISKLETGCLQVINRAFTQAPASLQYLKPYSLANLYKYLTSKALDNSVKCSNGFAAARFLCQAIRNDPSLLRAPVIVKVVFKIAVVTFLPLQVAQVLFTKVGKLSDVQALHGYLHLDPNKINCKSANKLRSICQ